MSQKDLETTLKEKVEPLLEETMEKHLGITIPQIEADITDRLKQPVLHLYVPLNLPFIKAKKHFKKEFFKKEIMQHKGNISQLAKTLDIDRRSVHRTIKELNISIDDLRTQSPLAHQEEMIGKTIRSTLQQYEDIIQPQKMEEMYKQVESLSRNIAKDLPHEDITWKDAEKEFEKQFLQHSLEEHDWLVSKTAQKLQLRPETLSRKIKKLHLKK